MKQELRIHGVVLS